MNPDWAGLVRSAHPSIVLPPGSRRAQVQVSGPLELERVLDLGAGHGVAVVRSAQAERWCVPLIAEGEQVRRSMPGDGTAKRLVRQLAAGGTRVDGDDFGTLSFIEQSPADQAAAVPLQPGERGVEVDQTNDSVIVDEAVVVKWSTRLPSIDEPGSPAASRITALVRAGFVDMPAPIGFLTAGSTTRQGQLLATAVAYLPGAEDGWDWATADLRAYLSGALSLAEAVEPARRLGAMTARMHAGLASMGSEPATADRARSWQQQARSELADAVDAVTGPFAERLARWRGRITEALDALALMAGTPTIAIHGDLHVGQVLRTRGAGGVDRLHVTDFDGNPTLPIIERWAPQPAAVDVVGMLASVDHVGRVVQYRDAGSDLGMIRTWIAAAQQAYLAAYRGQAADLGIASLLDERLLEPWRLWQEVREIRYAVAHLPHWVYVPELALADLLPEHPPNTHRPRST